MNLYAYVGNDPINATDPTGRQSEAAMDRRAVTGAAAMRNNPESATALSEAVLGQMNDTLNPLADVGAFVQNPTIGNAAIAAAGALPGPNLAKHGDKATAALRGGKAPEYDGGDITEGGFLDQAIEYLGEGYTEASPGRYVSADGTRQVRYGGHETKNPNNHHGHFESAESGHVTENTSVKIIPDGPN